MELRRRTHHEKSISERTVQKYLTVISAVLSDAKRNEIISKNPARMLDLPEPESRSQAIPSDEETQRFLNILVDEPKPFKMFYVLAIYTGCRRGELCALKWDDFTVDGESAVLTVSRSRSLVPGRGMVEGQTKNKRSRMIVLSDDMLSILRTYCRTKMRDAADRLTDSLFYAHGNGHGSDKLSIA